MQADCRRKFYLRSGYQRHRHLVGFITLTCPFYTDTGPPFLYGNSEKPPPSPNLVASYDALRRGYGGCYLDLNPRRPHGGSMLGRQIDYDECFPDYPLLMHSQTVIAHELIFFIKRDLNTGFVGPSVTDATCVPLYIAFSTFWLALFAEYALVIHFLFFFPSFTSFLLSFSYSSVRLHIHVPSHIWLKYRWLLH